MANVADDISKQIEQSMTDLPIKEADIRKIYDQSAEKARRLQKLIRRAEEVCQTLDGRVSGAQRDLNQSKEGLYVDIRELLKSGMSSSQVREELGVSEAEVSLVERVAYR